MEQTQARKHIAILMTLVCAFTLCFALFGCGGNPKANFVGDWEVTEMEDPSVGTIDASALKAFGLTISMTLNDDGSAKFEMFGQTVDATWEAKSGSEMSLTIAGGATDTFTLKDGKLVGESDGSKMVMEKVKK